MHRWHKSVAAAAAFVGVAGLGVALHDPATTDQKMTLTAAGGDDQHPAFTVRGTAVEDLYPGAHRRLVLTFTNPSGVDLLVTGMHARLTATSKPGCAPVASNLEVEPYTGALPARVDARDSLQAGAVPLHMPNSVVDACQEATFTVAVTADAVADR
ncbi:hypothetical protein AB0J80_03525 [Actinoplanes sp. NPDC049548]|uniref:hypothetical protein n=1 Tax=Actinoplanes sp. NPDC049548 TaxID=3155152 RepID=UPI003439CE65